MYYAIITVIKRTIFTRTAGHLGEFLVLHNPLPFPFLRTLSAGYLEMKS